MGARNRTDLNWWSKRQAVQTDAERQAEWSNWSRAIGEGQFGSAPAGPGFFKRVANIFRPVEYRAVTSLPWNTGGTLAAPTSAPSVDGALALGAVYAATSLIARTIAGIPLHAYRDEKGKK